jgi:ribosomal-protein-serine acetyltransferase
VLLETVVAAGFPERLVIQGRDDFYLRQSRASEAEAIFGLIQANPYIGEYQYWARDDSLEKTIEGIAERMSEIRAGTSVQYRIIVPAVQAYDSIVGTLTAYDYDAARGLTKIGYYMAQDAQGKGYMRLAVARLIEAMKEIWNMGAVEFDIEDGNERSENLVSRLGAARTEEFKDYERQGTTVPNRIWRLAV